MSISIHLMLLFISISINVQALSNVISIHLMLLFIGVCGLRTTKEIEFQYISCYCLSVDYIVTLLQMCLFQYISCYCLSRIQQRSNFETMQFQYISCYCLSMKEVLQILQIWNFNTSHVTVYLSAIGKRKQLLIISIHLMLLFILTPVAYSKIYHHFNTSHVTVYHNNRGWNNTVCIFQYISCYCLSKSFVFYGIMCTSFQYISCYCLSGRRNL